MAPDCVKRRAAAQKAAASTRNSYSPRKIGGAKTSLKSFSQAGTPKVRMSFGSRNR